MGNKNGWIGENGVVYDTWRERREAEVQWRQQERQNQLLEKQQKASKEKNRLLKEQNKLLEEQNRIMSNNKIDSRLLDIEDEVPINNKKSKISTLKQAIKRDLENNFYDDILKYLELQNYEEFYSYKESYTKKIHLLPVATDININEYYLEESDEYWGTIENQIYAENCSKELGNLSNEIKESMDNYDDKYFGYNLHDDNFKNQPQIIIYIFHIIMWCLIICPIFYFVPYIFTYRKSPLLAIISGLVIFVHTFLNYLVDKNNFDTHRKERTDRLSKINEKINEYNTLAKGKQEEITKKLKSSEEKRINNFDYELEYILDEVYDLGLKYNKYPADYKKNKKEYFEKLESNYSYFNNLTIDIFCKNYNEQLKKYYEFFGENLENEQLESTDINSYCISKEDFSNVEALENDYYKKLLVAEKQDIHIELFCSENGIIVAGLIGKNDEIDNASNELIKRIYLPFLSTIAHKNIEDSIQFWMSMLDTENWDFNKESIHSKLDEENYSFSVLNKTAIEIGVWESYKNEQ